AGFGFIKLTSPSPTPCEKIVWSALLAGVMLIGVYLLLSLQRHMHTTRARQWRMEEAFSPEDRRLARNEPPALRPDGRGPMEWFVVVLCTVVAVAGILAGYAIWRLP